MAMPEIFTATAEHAKMLDEIQGHDERAFGQYMDTVAEDVIAAGGMCDETTFLRSFFATYQRPEYRYDGGAPQQLKSALCFAKWLHNKAAAPVVKVVQDAHVGVPRVISKPTGIVLRNELDPSQVVSYDIEKHSVNGRQCYSGFVSFDTLWTPQSPERRRVEDISEDCIDEFDILTIDRLKTDKGVTIVECHGSDTDMGILLGSKNIERARNSYEKKSAEAFEQSQRTVRAAARIMQLPTL